MNFVMALGAQAFQVIGIKCVVLVASQVLLVMYGCGRCQMPALQAVRA